MPAKTNFTIKIDTNLLREAKILAAREDTSVSALMLELLKERIKKDLDYEQAKQRAIARMKKGWNLGWTPPRSRDELYER